MDFLSFKSDLYLINQVVIVVSDTQSFSEWGVGWAFKPDTSLKGQRKKASHKHRDREGSKRTVLLLGLVSSDSHWLH